MSKRGNGADSEAVDKYAWHLVREAAGISQTEMAEAVGVSRQRVSLMEQEGGTFQVQRVLEVTQLPWMKRAMKKAGVTFENLLVNDFIE